MWAAQQATYFFYQVGLTSWLPPGPQYRCRRGCPGLTDRAPFDLKDMALRQIFCPQVPSLHSSKGLHIITQRVGDLDLLDVAATCTFPTPGTQGPLPAGF
jgi:hypothetical protein